MAEEETPPEPAKDPAPDLGDQGKKALDAERKARRDAEKQLKEMADRLKQLEDADKSESERLTERLTAAEQRATQAEARADRFEVALAKGLDMTRAKRLTGTTREELEADADELQTWQAASTAPEPTPGKPTEALSGGGDPTQEPSVDVRAVVDSIPRGF